MRKFGEFADTLIDGNTTTSHFVVMPSKPQLSALLARVHSVISAGANVGT